MGRYFISKDEARDIHKQYFNFEIPRSQNSKENMMNYLAFIILKKRKKAFT